jgi:hypothetical protein
MAGRADQWQLVWHQLDVLTAEVSEKKRQAKTTPFGVNSMRSQALHRAAQGLKGVNVVLARPVVRPTFSSL